MIRCPDLTRRILAPVTTGSHCSDSRCNSMQVAARSVQCSLVWNRLLLLFLGGPIFPDGIGSASMSGALDKANKDQEASVPGFPKVGFGAGLSAFLITTLARRICQHTRTYCRCTDGTRGAKPPSMEFQLSWIIFGCPALLENLCAVFAPTSRQQGSTSTGKCFSSLREVHRRTVRGERLS